jgi:hypothetical protein
MSEDELRDSNETRQRRTARGLCTGGCGKPHDGPGKKCAKCLAKEKENRDALIKAGRCPRCGRKKPKELGLCLKCSARDEEELRNLNDGDLATTFAKHPTIRRKLARGVSRLTKK